MSGKTANYDGLSGGSTGIGVDAQFLDPVNEDYHLTVDSPGIQRGRPSIGCRWTTTGIGARELCWASARRSSPPSSSPGRWC